MLVSACFPSSGWHGFRNPLYVCDLEVYEDGEPVTGDVGDRALTVCELRGVTNGDPTWVGGPERLGDPTP